MRSFLFFPLACSAVLLAAAEPTATITLKDADKLRVLSLQREQYKAFAEREKAQKEALEAQHRLDDANARMTNLEEEFRRTYACRDCILQENLSLAHPKAP